MINRIFYCFIIAINNIIKLNNKIRIIKTQKTQKLDDNDASPRFLLKSD
jgi:hypothetical protein